MQISGLRCEYRLNPIGIDVPQPCLSWGLQSDRRGACQRAYQIQAMSEAGAWDRDVPDVWDSGKVEADQSHLVPYGGPALSAGQWVYWRVRVWDEQGEVSPWSETAWWSMGPLAPADWGGADWIGLDRLDPDAPPEDPDEPDDYRRLPARYLRRGFSLKRPVARAQVSVCGLGICELHLNGQRVAEDEVMNPAQTDFERRALYRTYDVTARLRDGANAIGAVLGNGRFQGLRPRGHRVFGFPKLILRLDVYDAEGGCETVVSDADWRVTDQGPIRANHEYDGETYDARLEMSGWDVPGFDDRAWEPVESVAPPGGTLEADMVEPTARTGLLQPLELTRHASGVWLADFGETVYGQPRIRVTAPAGTAIRIWGAYSLRGDGTLKLEDNRGARCEDVYICKGGGEETWSPRFRGQGCRWLQLAGWPGALTADALALHVVRQGAEPAGSFVCSDPLLNRIHANVGRGVRAFLRQGLPMEPDRDERQPWLGDPACDARTYAAFLGVAPLLRKWLKDIRLAQREDGSIPAIAPMYWTYRCKTDAVWPAVITILPDWFYRHYGDIRVVADTYPVAARWVAYLERGMRPDGTTDDAEYGDWCDVASMDGVGSDHGATSRPLIASAYLCHSANLLARMADILGRADDADAWKAKAAAWTDAFNRRFFDAASASYASGTQCALLLPLAFELVPAGQRERVLANLVADILVTRQGHTSVGLIGNQWLLPTLSRLGRADVAHTVATRTERPSWGYMVQRGASSIWERWDSDTRGPGMNSEALLIQAGTLGAWFVETLAGIAPAADTCGCRELRLEPCMIPELEAAGAEILTPYGPVSSRWRHVADRRLWTVQLPPNVTASIRVPVSSPAAVTVDGWPLQEAPGVRLTAIDDEAAVCCQLASGTYGFSINDPAAAQ